jgi:hypothetical protein
MMPMKLYEVELLRTSYRTYRVEALDENQAVDEAWELLKKDVPQSELEMWDFNSTDPYEP